jgi:hypothetical protein
MPTRAVKAPARNRLEVNSWRMWSSYLVWSEEGRGEGRGMGAEEGRGMRMDRESVEAASAEVMSDVG